MEEWNVIITAHREKQTFARYKKTKLGATGIFLYVGSNVVVLEYFYF